MYFATGSPVPKRNHFTLVQGALTLPITGHEKPLHFYIYISVEAPFRQCAFRSKIMGFSATVEIGISVRCELKL
jgi:hypothetical protein